jgi:hypothetical protein
MSGNQQQAGPWEPLVFEDYTGGLNTLASRPSIADNELAWCDGFMPVGPGKLRVVPDHGSPIFTAGTGLTISFYDFGNVASTQFCIIVTSDGAVWRVNVGTLAAVNVLAAGTITSLAISTKQIGLSQWGNLYLILVSAQTNGYWFITDTTVYSAGGAAPGGGTMPTGIQGSQAETYQSRVWVLDGASVFFSAPGSPIDFTTASGGGAFTSNDSFLRVAYVNAVQTNGFLYLIADSSINYISNVQTSGSPVVTTFTNQNANAEIGTPYPQSVTTLGSNIALANSFGVHLSYGGQVVKISEKLDGIYNTGSSAGSGVSVARCILYGKRCLVVAVPVLDPFLGSVIKLCLWDEKKWWTCPSSANLVSVGGLEINSVLGAFGSDGTSLYPLFTTLSTATAKVARSKLFGKPGGYMTAKSSNRAWFVASYASPLSPNVTFSTDNETSAASYTFPVTPTGAGQFYVSPPDALSQVGNLLGITISTNAADMTLVSAAIDAVPVGYRG